MEDLSNNTEVITQAEFILSKAISNTNTATYQVELICKHAIVPHTAETPIIITVQKTSQGYKGNFYHDYNAIKDRHDFSGSAKARLFTITEEGIVQSHHNVLFAIRNVIVTHSGDSYELVMSASTTISLAIN